MGGWGGSVEGPQTRRYAATSPPKGEVTRLALVEQRHLSLGGEVGQRPGEADLHLPSHDLVDMPHLAARPGFSLAVEMRLGIAV